MNGAIRIRDKSDLAVIFSDLAAMYGYDQKHLATEAGYYQSQISMWLRGIRAMDVTSVIDLATPFGYDLALITSGGFEGAQPYDWCPCVTLAKVPAEVREHAKVLLRYLDRAELVQRAEEHTEVCR